MSEMMVSKESLVRSACDTAIANGFPKALTKLPSVRKALFRLYAKGHEHALSGLAYEFESHDYFSEARMTRSFSRTSDWVQGIGEGSRHGA